MFHSIIIKVADMNEKALAFLNLLSKLIMILFNDTVTTAWLYIDFDGPIFCCFEFLGLFLSRPNTEFV